MTNLEEGTPPAGASTMPSPQPTRRRSPAGDELSADAPTTYSAQLDERVRHQLKSAVWMPLWTLAIAAGIHTVPILVLTLFGPTASLPTKLPPLGAWFVALSESMSADLSVAGLSTGLAAAAIAAFIMTAVGRKIARDLLNRAREINLDKWTSSLASATSVICWSLIPFTGFRRDSLIDICVAIFWALFMAALAALEHRDAALIAREENRTRLLQKQLTMEAQASRERLAEHPGRSPDPCRWPVRHWARTGLIVVILTAPASLIDFSANSILVLGLAVASAYAQAARVIIETKEWAAGATWKKPPPSRLKLGRAAGVQVMVFLFPFVFVVNFALIEPSPRWWVFLSLNLISIVVVALDALGTYWRPDQIRYRLHHIDKALKQLETPRTASRPPDLPACLGRRRRGEFVDCLRPRHPRPAVESTPQE